MNIGIDWAQKTTKLGAIMLGAAALSVYFICVGQFDKAAAIMTLAGTLAGTLGLLIKV